MELAECFVICECALCYAYSACYGALGWWFTAVVVVYGDLFAVVFVYVYVWC